MVCQLWDSLVSVSISAQVRCVPMEEDEKDGLKAMLKSWK